MSIHTTVKSCEIVVDNGSIQLEGLIVRTPRDARPQSGSYAVVAHPWPALGGTMNDRVVTTLASTLANMGITVLTYNSRGTGSSTGRASWTGEAERRDFGHVVEWFLEQELAEKGIVAGSTTMVCCGYSFGALAASAYSPSPTLSHKFEKASASLTARHILVSPPVGFTSFFLVPFKYSSYTSTFKKILQADREDVVLPKALLVYGDEDQFSSVSDYKRYIFNITTAELASRLSVVMIGNGDHFYSSQEMRSNLCKAINGWI